MNAYTFAALATAQSAQSTVDVARGYPKAGVNVGGGIHVSPLFVTVTHDHVYQHPTLSLWAYVSDAVTSVALAAFGGLPVAAALDVTWVGMTVVGI